MSIIDQQRWTPVSGDTTDGSLEHHEWNEISSTHLNCNYQNLTSKSIIIYEFLLFIRVVVIKLDFFHLRSQARECDSAPRRALS